MGNINIIKASAGSGKTFRLAYEYIRQVVEDPLLYRHILAVTFTNKATEEMKQRIIAQIDALAAGKESPYLAKLERQLGLDAATIRARALQARSKILHDYSHFSVLTIDKFFQRIIRAFIREMGLDPRFTLELQTDSLLEGAADRLIDSLTADPALRDWVMRLIDERMGQSKGWDIRRELIALGGELFTERYQSRRGQRIPRQELERIATEAAAQSQDTITRMKRLAQEALRIAAEHHLSIDDFAHRQSGVMGFFVRIADREIEPPYGKRVADARESEDAWYTKTSPRAEEIRSLVPRLQELLNELCDLYDGEIRFLRSASLVGAHFRNYALMGDLEAQIAALCAEGSLLPISQTNALLAALIEGNDTPFIYEKAGNAFSRFMIDEFQDTSRRQWDNFLPLLENALSQSARTPVLLVGDVKQSIYRWRGGDWRILGEGVREEFTAVHEEMHPGEEGNYNYRSLETIVRFNNELIRRCIGQDNAQLDETLAEAVARGDLSPAEADPLKSMLEKAYRGHEQEAKATNPGGYVRVSLLPKEADDSAGDPIIALIEELQQRGFAPGQIALLVRDNKEGSALADRLLNHKAAHPESPYCYDLVSQEALTIGHAPVARFIAAVFTLCMDPADTIGRALYNQFRGLPLAGEISPEEEAFIRSLGLKPLEEAFEEVLLQYGLHLLEDQIAYLQAIQDQIHTFAGSQIADIPLFLAWWQEKGRTQSINLPPQSRSLTVITIHKAKGLEFPAVIIPSCDWALMPKSRSWIWAAAPGEVFGALGDIPLRWEKRIGQSLFAGAYYRESVLSHVDNLNLLYVAVTRASEELHLFLPANTAGERTGRLIGQALPPCPEGPAGFGALEGRCGEEQGRVVYSFGTPLHKEPLPYTPAPRPQYPVRRDDSKLKLHFDTQRYFPDDTSAPLSPRSHGMLMHRLFEGIDDRTGIEPELERWRREGLLSDEEAGVLRVYIAQALADERIASWFDPDWETVRNEQGIIAPGSSQVRRPDRVLTKGTRAVVVDYKFGMQQKPAYAAQLREYMELLRRMGYRDIRGYLWYVQRQQVEEIGLPE